MKGLQIDPKPKLPEGGIGVTFNGFPVSFSLAGILSGLLVLDLGEAFRQGLGCQPSDILEYVEEPEE